MHLSLYRLGPFIFILHVQLQRYIPTKGVITIMATNEMFNIFLSRYCYNIPLQQSLSSFHYCTYIEISMTAICIEPDERYGEETVMSQKRELSRRFSLHAINYVVNLPYI